MKSPVPAGDRKRREERREVTPLTEVVQQADDLARRRFVLAAEPRPVPEVYAHAEASREAGQLACAVCGCALTMAQARCEVLQQDLRAEAVGPLEHLSYECLHRPRRHRRELASAGWSGPG